MTPRLSGHFSIIGLVFFVLKSLLGISRQWSREKFAILSLKPLSHVKILIYHKIPKINPGASIFQRPFFRGLSVEGKLRFKFDWASVIVGRKFTVFALFYFVFEGNFQVPAPEGAYVWRAI